MRHQPSRYTTGKLLISTGLKGGRQTNGDFVGKLKLKKVTQENGASVRHNNTNLTTNITTTSHYIGGMVYETKAYSNATLQTALGYTEKLQLAGHEEGRIRPLYTNAASPHTLMGFTYDYFLKDHLGNTRAVITQELKQDIYPAATLEGNINGADTPPNAVVQEKNYYTINSAYIVTKPSAATSYLNNNGNPGNPNPSSNTTASSEKMYKLNSNTNKTGLGITLKVMAGDKLSIFGKSYFATNNSGVAANQPIPILDIITGLLGGPTGGIAAATHGGVTAAQVNTAGTATAGLNTLLANQTTNAAAAPTIPKAYINYIFFDEQFKVVSSGFSKVGTAGTVKTHTDLVNKPATKNGYVYIYVSNEQRSLTEAKINKE